MSYQIRAVRDARLFPTLLGRPLSSRLIRSGRRLAERNALPAYAYGNARRRVLSLGEDATSAMLSAEPSEPLQSRPSSRLQASPLRHPPRRQSGLQAVPTRSSPQGRQDSVRQAGHRPAVPKQKIAAYDVNPLPAASSLFAHSPQMSLGKSVRLLLNYPVTLYFSILFYGLAVCLSMHLYRQQSY